MDKNLVNNIPTKTIYCFLKHENIFIIKLLITLIKKTCNVTRIIQNLLEIKTTNSERSKSLRELRILFKLKTNDIQLAKKNYAK